MRKAIILLLFSLFCVFANAQGQQVKLLLKSGSSIVGTLVGMDGVTSVTISLAGIETTISMNDVQSIEQVAEPQINASDDMENVLSSDQYGEYAILDKTDYPESFTLSVGNQNFTMVLIRGGVYNMGYDDRHSLSYHSEPIHRVKLSSFYVSKEMVDEETAYGLLGKTRGWKAGSEFNTVKWEEARQVVDGIAEQEGLPYRLITEAEWEYMAITPYADMVFQHPMIEWCNDYFDDFSASSQIDPHGPSDGKGHVSRRYTQNGVDWDRHIFQSDYNSSHHYLVRIAISAEDVVSRFADTLF